MIRNLNVPLFLISLAIAVGIKFAVHETVQLSERVIEASVTYNPPAEDLVSYDLIEKVRINVRGKSNDVSSLTNQTIEVVADIPGDRLGATEIRLSPDNVRFNQSGEFEVLSITPNRVEIQVEKRLEAIVPIRVELYGEPAAGARQKSPTLDPTEARISGPRSKVEKLREVTAQVSLEGHARTFEETVPVTSTDPLVQIVQPTLVTVLVPMEEPELSIRFQELIDQPPDTP